MKTIIHVSGMENTEAIEAYVEKKLATLDRLLEQDDESIVARVEVGKSNKHHKKGDVFFAEVSVHMRGKKFMSNETNADLYAAIDAVKDELSREIKTYRGKKQEGVKRGGQVAKKALQKGL